MLIDGGRFAYHYGHFKGAEDRALWHHIRELGPVFGPSHEFESNDQKASSSDPAIGDIAAQAALFAFMNRIVDGLRGALEETWTSAHAGSAFRCIPERTSTSLESVNLPAMLVLRADPWMPEYGMGFDVAFDEPDDPVDPADPTVETEDWSTAIAGGPPPRGALVFVDGVRRIELRLIADEGARRAPGLFGSYAAGAVVCDGRARFAEHRVRRALVLGGGLDAERVALDGLTFDAETIAESDPDAPLLRLQTLMRVAEADLAQELAEAGGRLVLADGPLAYSFYERPTPSHVVGVVKRFARLYLDPRHGALLPRLAPGQRTPLFAIGHERRTRLAWYARLTRVRAPLHDHAGLVRCEVRYAISPTEAASLADQVTAALPMYVGHAWDPRAPQNLAPIAGLETWLRHRMGDTRLIRRTLLEWLATREAAA